MRVVSHLVSVIIPAYNAEAFVCQTLDSLLSQSYQNFEAIVVDDGSSDRTAEIIEAYAQKDARFKLLKQKNQGVAAARNLAIQASQGEFVAPLDADDVWHPDKLKKQVECILAADSSVGVVYTGSAFINEDGFIGKSVNPRHEGIVLQELIYGNILINASSPLIRRACLDEVGYYNCFYKEQNAQGCEDWDLYLRLAEKYEFLFVSGCLVGYRQVRGSMSSKVKVMERAYQLLMQEAHLRNPEVPNDLYRRSRSYYRCYLAALSGNNGYHGTALTLLFKALVGDPTCITQSYKTLVKNFVLLMVKPTHPKMYLQLQNRFNPSKTSNRKF